MVQYMNQRPEHGERYTPTTYEHIANVFTHGVAVVPAIFYCRNLLRSASSDAEYVNALLFGLAAIWLFLLSAVYHSISFSGKWSGLRRYLHKIDRATIHIFIAASYTPWLFLRKMGPVGMHMRWFVWLLAAFGAAYQSMYHEKYKLLEIILYLFTGIVPAMVTLFSVEDRSGLLLVALGGVAYVVGVVFFKCDGVIPCAHAIWHLHVFAGATLHYYAIHTYLMGRSGQCYSLGLPKGTKIIGASMMTESMDARYCMP